MVLVTAALLLATPVTAKNWEHHPSVEAVRAVVAQVDEARKGSRLSAKSLECEFETRTLWADGKGVVRQYHWVTGSGDSLHTIDAYYDEKGTLRFELSVDGAVPSAHSETRLWFDEAGQVLWKMHTFHGEGMDYDLRSRPDLWIRNPRADFAAKSDRGEECVPKAGPARAL